jgi:Rrf2 family protein
MKVSTKGRYALRLMLDLALNSNGEPVQIKEIAARQEISNKYLEQIISTLNKAGFVRSVRGPQGGYLLARNPEQYTVGMILRLTEGSMAPVSCLDEDANVCERQENCATLKLWKQLDTAIKGVIDHVTLQDLLDWQTAEEGADYYSI